VTAGLDPDVTDSSVASTSCRSDSEVVGGAVLWGIVRGVWWCTPAAAAAAVAISVVESQTSVLPNTQMLSLL